MFLNFLIYKMGKYLPHQVGTYHWNKILFVNGLLAELTVHKQGLVNIHYYIVSSDKHFHKRYISFNLYFNTVR